MRELLRALVSRNRPESASRALALAAGAALIVSAVFVSLAIGIRISDHGDVGSGAVGALLALTSPLAALVVANYRAKAPGPVGVPQTPDGAAPAAAPSLLPGGVNDGCQP